MPTIVERLPKIRIKASKTLLWCFFISGACGLVYEIAWLRVMGLIFGNTTYATSTVLAGYMAGLGLGAFLGGQWIAPKSNGIKVYAILEGGIGIYALLTPVLWKVLDFINVAFYRTFEPSFGVSLLFKFIVAFAALLVPTFLMGATLPTVSQYLVKNEKERAKEIGLLYALNTLGAVLGVLVSAFFLLQSIGVWQTVVLTGVLNFFIFYLCFFGEEPVKSAVPLKINLKKKNQTQEPAQHSPVRILPAEDIQPTKAPRALLLTGFAISGAVSMMYEIGWTRLLAMSLGSSIYAFSIMLATFLFGIAAGSYLFSIAAKYFKIDLAVFSLLQVLTGFFALIGMNSLNDMPYFFVQLFAISHGSSAVLECGKFILSSLIMLPPTLLIGAMFACFIHIYRRSKPLGHELGEAYFSNTAGTIFGSAFTGFFIIPALGIQTTLILAAFLNASVGIVLFLADKNNWNHNRLKIGAGMVGILLLAMFFVRPLNKMLIASELAVKPFKAVGLSKKDLLRSMEERELLFYKEGSSATVTVTKLRDNLSLAVNGKVDASNDDTFTQFLLGHLPMMLHPDPKNALVIGLGSGSTVAAVASYPVKKIDAVELEPAVVEGAKFFHKLNRNALEDPRLKLWVNDGRNFALLTQEKYDVIISEPSNPWMAGVANLFSYEHYKTMSKHLNKGGMVCQWLHAYSMSPDDLRMIVKTFTLAFKETSLWTSYYPDLMLIGSNDSAPVDFSRIQEAFKIPEVTKDLGPHGIAVPEGLFSSFWLSDKDLRRLASGAKTNSDNYPYLEFSAPHHLYQDTLRDNFVMLSAFRKDTLPNIIHMEPGPENNFALQKALVRGFIAKRMFAEAERFLTMAKQTNSTDSEVLLLEGIMLSRSGRQEEARDPLMRAISADSKNAQAYYELGAILDSKNENEKAGDLLKSAVVLEPKNPTYLSALGNHFIKLEQYPEAFGIYQRLLEINPDNFDSWGKNTFIFSKIGPVPDRIAAIQKFIQRYPRFVGGYQWLAVAEEAVGNLPAALEAYKVVEASLPQDAGMLLKLAELNYKLGHMDEMKEYAKKAVKANPALKNNPQIARLISQ